MRRYIDVFNEVVKEHKDRTALVGEGISLTYAQLDEAAGRIYAYLSDKGIGREDFIQIYLPRDPRICVSMLGVYKAGAAFTVLEDTYPKERTDFIYENCGCKVRLDEKLYEEIMSSYEPLAGNVQTDLHDACYAIYTSGSTGTPKGVLHEYGNIDEAIDSFDSSYDNEISKCAIYAPFYFVAGVIDFLHYSSRGRTTYIVPHDTIRDFIKCKAFIETNGIEEMYMPPSLLRIYKEPAKCLKVLYTGSEPANGLTYNGSPKLVNFYAMSESGFVVLRAELEKAYDVAPVGFPGLESSDVQIIDDDGNVVEGKGQGELCFKNEYVRGYINLPEQTAAAWRDGLFHTNDCARRDEDGIYYIVGRFDDMIKINGNRVEPVEIETQVKRLTGLEHVVAKGFANPERSYICVYYRNSEAEEKGVVKNGEFVIDKDELRSHLPDYMIPAYYVGVDSFPLTATGKISRKDLKAPDTQDYRREYVAPTNEFEKILCDKMAEVLKLDRVSVEDDFYELGGDSMRVMMFTTLCNEAGINVTSGQLYENRTPKKLAKVCTMIDVNERDRIDDEARRKTWTLLPSQKTTIAFGWQGEDKNTMSIVSFFSLKSEIDPEKLAKAAEKVLGAHPGMHVRMTFGDTYTQTFDESFTPDVKVLDLTEDDLEQFCHNRTYQILKEKLYSCNVIRTDVANYFHLDVHHSICDGTSRKLLLDQIAKAYFDDDYEVPRDYFFYLLSERFKEEWMPPSLPEGSTAQLIKMDHDMTGSDGAAVYRPGIAPKSEKRDGCFFTAALAVAVAKYNGSPDIRIKEVFAGRNELYTQDIAGELAIPVTLDLKVTDDTTFDQLMYEIKGQELYQSTHPSSTIEFNVKELPGMRVNYQKNTFDIGDFSKIADKDLIGKGHDTKMNGTFSMNIVELDAKDTIDALFLYNTSCYEKASMEKLMDIFLKTVKANL